MIARNPCSPSAERVLVVDDNGDTGELLSLLLEREGWETTHATSLAEAREALATGAFSALVTDVGLPDGNGLSLLAGGRSPGLRAALVTTGMNSAEERRRSREAAFDHYFVKPVDTRELIGTLKRLLGPPSVSG
jgi:DNA-binding response OmpR family regulator